MKESNNYYLTEQDEEEVLKRMKEIERRIQEEHENEILRPYFQLMHGERVKRMDLPAVINPVLDLYREEERLHYDKNDLGETVVWLDPKVVVDKKK
jgi:hypothetical protein